ncbi:MAG: hypothetical protein ACLTW9_15635 [Enterocloster sp.]
MVRLGKCSMDQMEQEAEALFERNEDSVSGSGTDRFFVSQRGGIAQKAAIPW